MVSKSRARNTNVQRRWWGQGSQEHVSDQSSESTTFQTPCSIIWPEKINNRSWFPTCRYPLNNVYWIGMIFGPISSYFRTHGTCPFNHNSLSIINTIISKLCEYWDVSTTTSYGGRGILYGSDIWCINTVHHSILPFPMIFLNHFVATSATVYTHHLSSMDISGRTDLGHMRHPCESTYIWYRWLCMTIMYLFRCCCRSNNTTLSTSYI